MNTFDKAVEHVNCVIHNFRTLFADAVQQPARKLKFGVERGPLAKLWISG